MKVFVVGVDGTVASMFRKQGFATTSIIEEADAVVWTGGADINPALYHQTAISQTHFTTARDTTEVAAYYKVKPDAFKIGICRGGQLLNVLNNGSMFQDVDNHGRGHEMLDVESGEVVYTTSLHHQMMRPAKDGKVLAIATGQSTFRLDDKYEYLGVFDDPEVIWYEKTKSFCFQGHPEFSYSHRSEETAKYFFDKLKHLGCTPE